MRMGAETSGEKTGARKPAAALGMVLAAAASLGLSGCGSFFTSSSNASHVVYVAGGLTAVTAYRIDDKTGSISNLVSAPYVAGNSPSSAVLHPSGKFLFVANAADSTISLFTINASSGSLTEVLPRTNTAGLSPGFMTMDSGGTYLFVADPVGDAVESFQIGAAGGVAPVSSISLGASPGALVLVSSGLLFVPLPNFSDIAVLSENAGVLQSVGLYPVATGVGGVAGDPGTKFLYATNPAANTVSGFAIQAGGALTAVPGLTSGTGTTPLAALVDTTGKFLYVINTGNGTVSQFTIDGTTGALTAFLSASVGVGTDPSFVVEDPDGAFVFVGNVGSSSVTELTIGSGGSLTNTNTISLGFVPRSVATAK